MPTPTGEERVWTIVPRHPIHAPPPGREHARHILAELDDVAEFIEHTIGIARQIVDMHTNASPARWLPEWELDVYENPDDLLPVRRYRFSSRAGREST
jgi:hypothetical protein